MAHKLCYITKNDKHSYKAYGITTQGLLYPNEYRFGHVLHGLTFKPIYMLFGEMFLGEVHHYQFEGLPSSNDTEECFES